MSTSKHIDRICIAVIAVTLALTLLFMNGSAFGLAVSERTIGYEDRLFSSGKVHTIDITINDWEDFLTNCESEEYSVCNVLIDEEKYSNIAIRAKGNTSLSSVRSMGSERYSFKLEFDHYQKGGSYHGLDKLSLNNLIQDNTMMKDYLVYTMMGSFGVDSPLCSYVYITVNGEDWGLYLAVEGVEDSFLERNYDSEGELYKPDSMSFGGGRGNGMDFDINTFDFDSLMNGDGTGDGAQETANSEAMTQGNAGEDTELPASTGSENGTETEAQNGSFGGGSMPQMPGGGSFGGNMPQMPDSASFGGNMPEMPDSASFDGNMPEMPGDFSGMPGGFGGMGSNDVKLQYIDDDPDSYSNIFDNAKTEISSADQKRLIEALKNLSEYTDLENTVDMEEVIRYFVVHNFVVNGDSYTGVMIHNYYLHEADGMLSMIPWDYNLAFGAFQGGEASSSVNTSIDSPVSMGSVDDRPMLGWIFSDEAYTEWYHEIFTEFIQEWLDSGKLVQLIGDTAEMLRPYVEKDPTKFCTVEEFDTGVETISAFVTLRGEAVSRQLSVDTDAVETGDLDLSAMGSMSDSMGGGFGGPGGSFPGGGFGGQEGSFPGDGFGGPGGSFPGGDFSADGSSFEDMDFSGMQPPGGNADFSGMQPPGGSADFSGMQPSGGNADFSATQFPGENTGFSQIPA